MLRLGLFLFATASFANAQGLPLLAPGRVFTMTNSASGNEIVSYARFADGSLAQLGSTPTGGLGTGGGLGSQGGLTYDPASRLLLAVNAGSNSVSVFFAHPFALLPLDTEPSGGSRPTSVSKSGDIVYVLNAGVPNNVTGFRLTSFGNLSPIPGAVYPLSADSTAPAQIEISPNGRHVVVTERMTNTIDTFRLLNSGLLANATAHASSGMTPFGFSFRNNSQFIVSEAFGGAQDASAVSSYSFSGPSTIGVISASVPTTESAACWIAIPSNKRYAYTTNTASDTISGFAVDPDGSLTILDADGVTATTGDGPTDMAFTGNGRFLYILNAAEGSVSSFFRQNDGSLLTIQPPVGGLPTSGSAGIVAY